MTRVTRLALAVLLALAILPPAVNAEQATWMESLHARLGALVSGWYGTIAVTVTDLQTDQSISVNGTRPQAAASTIKFYVAIAIAQQIDAGRISRSNVDGLMRAMMGASDNEAAYELIDMLGEGDIIEGTRNVNTVAGNLGAIGSALDSPPGHPEIDIGIANDNLLTSDDMNLILTRLYHGEVLTAASTDYVLQLMSLPGDWQNGSVGGPLPSDTDFYHKPGWIDAPFNTWNDAGIVTVNRNGQTLAYAITYLASRTLSEGDSYDKGYAVSDVVWQAFDAAYPVEPYRYFEQTRHAVGNGFLSYWEENGGLDVFGYPLTDELNQNGTTMQYFERARFEWHPGAAPNDYDVLLGLLGDELTNPRRVNEAPAFAPSPSRGDIGCSYFASTGHNLCGGFSAYWGRFGGLAIFGFPISEEFTENGYTVQYFERARFEWHPGEAPSRYDVLLGRLGAQALASRASNPTTGTQ